MDASTGLMLALQLVALCSIAGALLLYLLCKGRAGGGSLGPGLTKSVLVTSADTALGLQIAIHLAERGYRVFAGLRAGEESLTGRLARSWASRREGSLLVPLELDVTREDILHEAASEVTKHLPAGENGLWAVVNTAGVVHVGRLQQQDPAQWEAMLRTNVMGVLRTARTFLPLLTNAKGRFVNIGSSNVESEQQVCYAATRWAVEGASQALRLELKPYGIHVVTLQPVGLSTDDLFSAPKETGSRPETPTSTSSASECSVPISETMEYSTSVLGPSALRTIEDALSIANPSNSYELSQKPDSWFRRIPSLRSLKN